MATGAIWVAVGVPVIVLVGSIALNKFVDNHVLVNAVVSLP
jgi:hypothetical protein